MSKKGQPNLSKLRLLAAVGVETVEGNQLVPGAPDGFQSHLALEEAEVGRLYSPRQ